MWPASTRTPSGAAATVGGQRPGIALHSSTLAPTGAGPTDPPPGRHATLTLPQLPYRTSPHSCILPASPYSTWSYTSSAHLPRGTRTSALSSRRVAALHPSRVRLPRSLFTPWPPNLCILVPAACDRRSRRSPLLCAQVGYHAIIAHVQSGARVLLQCSLRPISFRGSFPAAARPHAVTGLFMPHPDTVS